VRARTAGRDTGLPQRFLDEPDLKVPARAVAHRLELPAQAGLLKQVFLLPREAHWRPGGKRSDQKK
jgi:hypothetical protein